MLNRNELITLRKTLADKKNKNTYDEQLEVKLQKLINEPTIVYEVNGNLYASKKLASKVIDTYKELDIHLIYTERIVS